MKQFKIISYYTGDTVELSDGTKLDGFKTKENAQDYINAMDLKATKEKDETHDWLMLVIPMGKYRKITPPTMRIELCK